MVNASVDDDDGENRHTGGVGSLSARHSIGGYGRATGITGFTADRPACSVVHEMKKAYDNIVNCLACGLVMLLYALLPARNRGTSGKLLLPKPPIGQLRRKLRHR